MVVRREKGSWYTKEWFLCRIKEITPRGCWIYGGMFSGKTNGYGIVWIEANKKRRRATKVVWELWNNKPWPEPMLACHTCDVPACITPEHIFPGTAKDNLYDAMRKGRRKPRRTVCPCGNPLSGDNVLGDGRYAICKNCHWVKQKARQLRKITTQ